MYTAIEQYIKLTSKLPEFLTNVGGIAILSDSKVHVVSNDLFDCGDKDQVEPLESFITKYKKAPFIEDTSQGNSSTPNYNLTGFHGVTKDQQENYVRGMIYDSAEKFMMYENNAQSQDGKEEKLRRCFRKLFQSLNLLRVQYDLKATDNPIQKERKKSLEKEGEGKKSPLRQIKLCKNASRSHCQHFFFDIIVLVYYLKSQKRLAHRNGPTTKISEQNRVDSSR